MPAPGDEPATAPPALSDAGARHRQWLARFLEKATDELQPEATHGDVMVTLLATRHSAWQHEADWLAAHLAAG